MALHYQLGTKSMIVYNFFGVRKCLRSKLDFQRLIISILHVRCPKWTPCRQALVTIGGFFVSCPARRDVVSRRRDTCFFVGRIRFLKLPTTTCSQSQRIDAMMEILFLLFLLSLLGSRGSHLLAVLLLALPLFALTGFLRSCSPSAIHRLNRD